MTTMKKDRKEKGNFPTLRFPEFEGEWEKKTLGEVAKIIGGGTPDTTIEEYWNGGIQWFTPTEIKSNYVSKSERTITELGLSKSSAKLLPAGTILLTTRATIGEVALATEECTTNQGFQSLVVKNGVNRVFIANWIKQNKKELIKRANGSTFAEIGKSEIEKIPILLPTALEQNKIASFLSLLDERITTQNKIIEELESLIKGLTNRLFSECFNNEKLVPLKSITSVITRKNNEKEDYPIMMITAEHGFINQNEKYSNDNAGSSLSKYTLLKQGELAYNRGSSKAKKYGSVFYLSQPNALIPYVYHSFSMNTQNCEAMFYAYLLNSKLLDKELRKAISSTARMDGLLNISKESFFSIKVPLPALKKQHLISTVLNGLKQKSDLEKDMRIKYQRQKQYILQQIFI